MKSILIYLSECEEVHFLPLIHLGIELIGMGNRVNFLLCSHGPCPGSHNIFSEVTDFYCINNRARVLKSLEEHGVEPHFLSDFFPVDGLVDSQFIFSQDIADVCKSYTYDGYDLGAIIRGTTFRYLQRTKIGAGDEAVIRHLLKTSLMHIKGFKNICDVLSPDLLVLFNGMTLFDHAARVVAEQKGVKVVAEENSCFADRKFLDPEGIILNRHQFAQEETWNRLKGKELSSEQKIQLRNYLDNVYAGKTNTVSQREPESLKSVREKLGFNSGQPLALLLGQVPFDSVIAYDSPHYEHLDEFINHVISIFSEMPDWGLVVRLHPLETILYGSPTVKALPKSLPENVRLVIGREYNTYDLMDLCRFGVTINSQSGLEMLAKHKPVLIAGDAFYGHKGFTVDLGKKEELGLKLEQVMASPALDKEQISLVDRFLYRFIFEYLVPFDRQRNSFGEQAVQRFVELLDEGEAGLSSVSPLPPPDNVPSWKEIQYHYLNAIKQRDMGLLEESLESLNHAVLKLTEAGKAQEGGRIFFERIQLLQQLGEKDSLLAELNRLAPLVEARDRSFVPEFLTCLAFLYFDNCRWLSLDQTLDFLEMSAPENHSWSELQWMMAIKSIRCQDWDDAGKRLMKLNRYYPENIDFLFQLARVARHLQNKGVCILTSIEIKQLLSYGRPCDYFKDIINRLFVRSIHDSLKKMLVLCWFLFRRAA